jgi:hypothetical protein
MSPGSFPVPVERREPTFCPLLPSSILTDCVLGSVLLLAGHGLLMVVRRSRLALLGLRVLSMLRLASLNGVLAFLMRACPLLTFRPSIRLGVLFFGAHVIPPPLHLAAIAADLLRSVVHTVRDGLSIELRKGRERVLIFGGAVANSLSGTGDIGRSAVG